VQFNLFHDQLVLTSSSDSQVLLTRLASIASEPLHQLGEGDEDEEEDGRQGENVSINKGLIILNW